MDSASSTRSMSTVSTTAAARAQTPDWKKLYSHFLNANSNLGKAAAKTTAENYINALHKAGFKCAEHVVTWTQGKIGSSPVKTHANKCLWEKLNNINPQFIKGVSKSKLADATVHWVRGFRSNVVSAEVVCLDDSDDDAELSSQRSSIPPSANNRQVRLKILEKLNFPL